jgi:hypothetical protein
MMVFNGVTEVAIGTDAKHSIFVQILRGKKDLDWTETHSVRHQSNHEFTMLSKRSSGTER